MILAHFYKNRALTRAVTDKSNCRFVCMSNNSGSFFLTANKVITRFQGLYFNLDGDLFKILEDIEVDNDILKGLFNDLGNNGGKLYRQTEASFKFVSGKNIFIYCLSTKAKQIIFLDPRRIFEYPEFGRQFTLISQNARSVILRYDYTQNTNNYTLFIGFKALPGECLENIEVFDEWVKREYSYDQQRSSPPDALYICKKLAFISKGFLITAAKDIDQLTKNMHYDVNVSDFRLRCGMPPELSKFKFSYLEGLIKESITRLKVKVRGVPFFYAGLPWFNQFWLRDEALSLDVLLIVLTKRERYDFLKWRLDFIEKHNFFPNFFNLDLSFSEAPSYDGTLIFFLKTLKTLNSLGELDEELRQRILKIFFIWLERFFNDNLKGNVLFLSSTPVHSQWMDSLKERSGSLIEIEALILALLKYASNLSNNSKWLEILKMRQEVILKTFWNGSVLADKANCFGEIRPNIFLAYSFFPDLLSKTSWEKIIDEVLENLWLEWGGLATIAKTSPLYKPFHTGEDPLSYHNGDSWLFLNAIAADCLLDFQRHTFRAIKIYEKLVSDFLWFNTLGFSSELSEAEVFNPRGSPIQLWSACMLLKLAKKIKKRVISKS